MSIGPTVWGPVTWQSMHYISLGYPIDPTPEQKEIYKNYYLSYQIILPCSVCANHYKENLKKVPLTDDILSTRDKLIQWVIDIHNEVNIIKNKKVLSYEEAYNDINSLTKICNHKASKKSLKNNKLLTSKTNINNINDIEDDMSTTCYLIAILIALVFIVIIYK
jgi:hypothetical protein